ncbi:MAG TPA: hypothetical protein VGS16_11465 [Candidatus Dormibacteraeota bacterium]|nr:hypothetical protein [Candidatus Dormibacteraeota bacterium]
MSDGHVRYDRATQRWFITEIDVPAANNHILLAVSSGADLTTASWTQFAIPTTGGTIATDSGCFADYDTPGIDQNGIYIGENMFGGVSPCTGTNYKHSNLYVIQKSSALTTTLHFTPFYNVVTGLFAVETIQGVDSVDSLATGYAVAVKETENPSAHLSVWTITNPGTTAPTLSGPTDVAINAETGPRGGVLSANNVASAHPTRPMDDLDDRLFSAVIRNGHLWTAHNVGVDSTGNSNATTLTRDAVRWYDVTVAGPTLNQSGTVFDSAASGFQQYWMGTVMVSGQGHVAMGLNRANGTTVVQAGAVGRLAGDALGTMGGFSIFQSSTSDAYDDFAGTPANRWGDYTYTSLDPCDDMTMWTAQEYVAGSAPPSADWGVAAERLQAPAPATPTSASPSSLQTGQASVNVAITGTSASGSGFYDTPSTLTDPCRKRIAATVSGGVIVNSITYTDPTHITLNLSTVSASSGPQSLTVTNPDGQVVVANNFLTIQGQPYVVGLVGTDNGLWVLHSGSPTFTADGGVLIGAPAVVAIPQTSGPAKPIYIATGSDHSLYVRSDTLGWQSLSGGAIYCLDNPAGVVIALTLYVACEGGDHALWHAETAAPTGTNLPAVNPSSWKTLGGVLGAGPAVASVGGTPTYFVLGADQHIYSRTLASSNYTGFSWTCMGHPAVASFGSTSYFGCHGTDAALWYSTNTGGGWSAPQSLGGTLVDGVGVVATSTGPLFFVEGVGGGVYHRSISTGWMSDGGQVKLGVGASSM